MEEIISDMNGHRKTLLKQYMLQMFYIGITSLILTMITKDSRIFFYASFVLAFLLYIKHQGHYSRTAKALLFLKIALKFPEVDLSPKGFNEDVVQSSSMLKRGSSFTSENLITIKKDKRQARSANVRITVRKGSGKRRRTVTLFKGNYLVFTYENLIKGRHHIEESGRCFFEGKGDFRFEDQEFMDKFKVESNHDLELFKLLTPEVILLLKKIEVKNPGRIQFCFFSNELHVSIYNNEVGPKLSLFSELDNNYVETIISEINFLNGFMNEMDIINRKFSSLKERL